MGKNEVLLSGDSLVVRVGDSVRRPAQPWTASVAALLGHLHEVGYDGAPRSLGVDEQGREAVTYLPGEPKWPYAKEVLVAAARLLRRLHEALQGFTEPRRRSVGPPAGQVGRAPLRAQRHRPVEHRVQGRVALRVHRLGVGWPRAGPA